MQDRKALQAGTSHFLGQNFAKAQEIKFQNEAGDVVYAWTTSWGASTRLVGGLVMTHADDDGLVIPPRLAPAHLVILPIYRNDQERADVLRYCEEVRQRLAAQVYADAPVRVRLDDRDLRGGEKKWQWIKRGVPLLVEIGPRDVEKNGVFVARRDVGGRGQPAARDEFVAGVRETLDDIQQALFDRAARLRDENTRRIDDFAEFKAFFTPKNEHQPELHGGLANCHFVEGPEMDEKLKDLKVSIRCVPLDAEEESGTCIFTGKPSRRRGVFAKAY